MTNAPLLGWLRYLGSVGIALGVVALSIMFIFDMPSGDTVARAATVTLAPSEPARSPKPARTLKASDLDISKSVAVNVATPAVAASTSPEVPEIRVATVETAANLRAAPTRQSARFGGLQRGAKVAIIRAESGWTLVDPGDGLQGWLASKFLAD